MSRPASPSAAPDDPACIVQVEGLGKDYDGGRVQALKEVNLSIGTSDFVAILGPSGCGKSTLLQMIGALDEPTAGTVCYRGRKLDKHFDRSSYRSREVGFIFQAFHLLPTFTALENVQIPMMATRLNGRQRLERARELLHSVGLGERLDHVPAMLSGGERQRVAIARSLANDPRLLLADEPTGNLDSDSAGQIIGLLTRIHREKRMTILMVTHNPGVAAHAGREIQMKDGRVLADFTRQPSAAAAHQMEGECAP